jgi:hypothetical protein
MKSLSNLSAGNKEEFKESALTNIVFLILYE